MKRTIDSLYKNPSPATSSNKGKTKQNDGLSDRKFKDKELEKEEINGPYYQKIFKRLRSGK